MEKCLTPLRFPGDKAVFTHSLARFLAYSQGWTLRDTGTNTLAVASQNLAQKNHLLCPGPLAVKHDGQGQGTVTPTVTPDALMLP